MKDWKEGIKMLYWLKVITLVVELVVEGLSQMEAIDRIAEQLGLTPEEIKRWMS